MSESRITPVGRRRLDAIGLALLTGAVVGTVGAACTPAYKTTVIEPAPSTSTIATTIAPPPTAATTVPTTVPAIVHHAFPVAVKASYARVHHDYPASDVFAACGSEAQSPVDGVIVHWRTDDAYVARDDDPALRGGRSLAVLGDDGVRYYLSHFARLDDGFAVGTRVTAGDPLAVVGRSGDASACHIHFGLSPDCPNPEWSVRRGVIWPWPYLDAWKAGGNDSPAAEVTAWSAAHPGACAEAAADPHAAEAG